MKKLLTVVSISLFIFACSPKVGSEQWCSALKEKAKADWTATEMKDFTKHCIF
jgi:hypothetical protein